ncbi:hypothetical protein Moror_9569 [Moniliophthora roreri MCA 2997]|uniref:F-box domain-containing protein n=1 Tax=Moniliophthora roreri (strain MCA 2997) TaxID=1381753 RepID=V2YHC7_MONRO|nr:hypothetical protein Moror_9569 [Moniliophthora roreri MCA 2997]
MIYRRHWRYIVLNTPLLWDRLKINTRDGRNISRACGILVECLRRAADNKLQLSITADVAYEYYDCQPLYDLVLDRCEDWESLKLVIFGQVPPIIPPPGAKLSSLRRFEIRPQLLGVLRASGTDTGILKSLMQTVQRAPSVEYACFDGTSLIDRHMLSGAIPGTAWVNLRTLELHTYEGADLISVLSNCSSRLERLILAELNVAIPVDGDVVEFPVLKTLKLKRFAPYWLRRLSLPRLEHLVLTYLDIQRDTSPLFDMVQRQGFSIRSVSFIDIVFMDVTVERFLRLTPHATTLTVTGTVFPYIFDRIALDKNILPHLTTLVVRPSTWMDNRIISPPLATILRVVVSRLDTLKVVKVEALLRPCETEVVEQIRSLHRHGILVEVKVLPVKDGEYLEVPEIILLMSGAMIFTPLFGSKPTIRNPEEASLLYFSFLVTHLRSPHPDVSSAWIFTRQIGRRGSLFSIYRKGDFK